MMRLLFSASRMRLRNRVEGAWPVVRLVAHTCGCSSSTYLATPLAKMAQVTPGLWIRWREQARRVSDGPWASGADRPRHRRETLTAFSAALRLHVQVLQRMWARKQLRGSGGASLRGDVEGRVRLG